MKIGVMQTNKRIAIGKCVTVLYSCQAQFKRRTYFDRNYNSVSVMNRLNLNISDVSMVLLTLSS